MAQMQWLRCIISSNPIIIWLQNYAQGLRLALCHWIPCIPRITNFCSDLKTVALKWTAKNEISHRHTHTLVDTQYLPNRNKSKNSAKIRDATCLFPDPRIFPQASWQPRSMGFTTGRSVQLCNAACYLSVLYSK